MDNKIVVAFDIHETIFIGLIGHFNKIYKGDLEFVRKISHMACNSSILVGIYTLITRKNKNICKKMKDLYEQNDLFEVVILTDSHRTCYKILKFILKLRGINYYSRLICRDYIFENTLQHKIKKIKEYNISFIYDDNPNMRYIMNKTDCHVIGMID